MASPTFHHTRRPTVPEAEEILGGYFRVLDHGFVALVDYMGADEDVERAARVSYGYGTRKVSETRGLIRYLRRHLHTTPSEMVEFKFHCAMPIFVARQWIRHRTASVNEYSGRYSIMPLLFYKPKEDHFALQDATNKQGRAKQSLLPGFDTHLAAPPDPHAAERSKQSPLPGFDADGLAPSSDLYRETVERWEDARSQVSADYEWLVEQDVARELARIDLPLSTYTQWYWKIDLHNLLHFLTLRVDPHAQWEIQEYGRKIAGMVKRVAPLSYQAWIDYQVMGARLSRGELEALSRLVAADEDGVAARPGASASNDELVALDLSPREVRELKTKLQPRPTPDFDLDLSAMQDAAAMRAATMREAEMHAAEMRNRVTRAAAKQASATPSKTAGAP